MTLDNFTCTAGGHEKCHDLVIKSTIFVMLTVNIAWYPEHKRATIIGHISMFVSRICVTLIIMKTDINAALIYRVWDVIWFKCVIQNL